MGILAAAVAIVGAVVVLNLLLTFGVIRRLREHNDLLAEGAGAAPEAPTLVAVGEPVAQFTATAVDGSVVSPDRFVGPTLVGVFAPGCKACKEKVPGFVERAGSFAGGRQNVLAVVVGSDEGGAGPYVDALTEVAVVVREDRRGPVSTALGVIGFPAFALVDEGGVIRAGAHDPGRLPAPVAGSVNLR